MRHLRGDTLEDVIFTGSAQRKPLGMAEVSLTMFNNRGVLPSEYTEIAIDGARSGTDRASTSSIKKPCRLRDVRDLFLDTGMGSHAYSLIERGMVDNVLSDESGQPPLPLRGGGRDHALQDAEEGGPPEAGPHGGRPHARGRHRERDRARGALARAPGGEGAPVPAPPRGDQGPGSGLGRRGLRATVGPGRRAG